MHCLKWVMRLYTSKLTPDSVVTYLFIDCECSLWLFCLAWHVCVWWSKHNTPRLTARPPVLRVCAMFDGLTEFWFEFRFSFRASLLDFTSRIERLHVCYYCADVLNVLAYFCSEYSRASPSTGRSCQVIDSVCMPPVFMTCVADQLFALNRGCCSVWYWLRPGHTLCTGA